MIIKLLLSAALAIVAAYAITQRRATRFFHSTLVLLTLVGAYFVWFPEQTTAIANHLGVGRGTDLLLYSWIIISLFLLVSLYLQMRRQLHMITKLARRLSLQSLLGGETGRAEGADRPNESASGTRSSPIDNSPPGHA